MCIHTETSWLSFPPTNHANRKNIFLKCHIKKLVTKLVVRFLKYISTYVAIHIWYLDTSKNKGTINIIFKILKFCTWGYSDNWLYCQDMGILSVPRAHWEKQAIQSFPWLIEGYQRRKSSLQFSANRFYRSQKRTVSRKLWMFII